MSNLKMTTIDNKIPDGSVPFRVFVKASFEANYAGLSGYVKRDGDKFTGEVAGEPMDTGNQVMKPFLTPFSGTIEGTINGPKMTFTLTNQRGAVRKFDLVRPENNVNYEGHYQLIGMPYQLLASAQISK